MNNFVLIYVIARQSLVDFAMQVYGCYDGVFLLLQDNPAILNGISDVPQPGMALKVRTPVPMINSTNQLVATYYASKGTMVIMDAVDAGNAPTPAPVFKPYVVPGYIAGTTAASPFGKLLPPLRIITQLKQANLLTTELQKLLNP